MASKSSYLKELLAQARAIHFAMRNGALTYRQAKERTQPYLEALNKKVEEIAKKFNQKPRKITFQDLGRNFR